MHRYRFRLSVTAGVYRRWFFRNFERPCFVCSLIQAPTAVAARAIAIMSARFTQDTSSPDASVSYAFFTIRYCA